MRHARGLSVVLAAVLGLAGLAMTAEPAAELQWLTSFDQAKAESEKTGKPILADFTGSDWCGWCVKLKKEVFDTKEFKEWAAQKVVLLEVDFPRRKEQPPAVKEANAALQKKYGIRGYPTILFLEPDGTKIGETGYRAGGPKAWTGQADTILAGRKAAGK